METPTPFGLTHALQQWRANLQNLGGLGAEDLEELEGHLRESISALHAGRLSVQEAFTIATRRLGSERELSDEFAKANPRRVWTERALWMVAGLLIADALFTVTSLLPNIVTNCALRAGVSGPLAVASDFLVRGILWVGAAAVVYWMLSRHSVRRDRVVASCIRQPVLTGLGLFIGLECLPYLMNRVIILANPVINFFGGPQVAISPQTMAIMTSWSGWGSLLTQLIWVGAVPLLAGYAWRKRGKSSALGSLSSYGLQPGEEPAAGALQSQGLSLDEAGLILASRRNPPGAVAPSLGRCQDRSVWLARAVWMVSGAALIRCLELLVLSPAWLLAVATRPEAPLLQHLAGLGSVCLGLTLACAIIGGLWRWVARHPGRSASIGRVCRLRPLVAAIGLVVVCAGFGFCEYALFIYVIHPADNSMGLIGSEWLHYGSMLNHLLIPIALLLWLARRAKACQAIQRHVTTGPGIA